VVTNTFERDDSVGKSLPPATLQPDEKDHDVEPVFKEQVDEPHILIYRHMSRVIWSGVGGPGRRSRIV